MQSEMKLAVLVHRYQSQTQDRTSWSAQCPAGAKSPSTAATWTEQGKRSQERSAGAAAAQAAAQAATGEQEVKDKGAVFTHRYHLLFLLHVEQIPLDSHEWSLFCLACGDSLGLQHYEHDAHFLSSCPFPLPVAALAACASSFEMKEHYWH